ncbi:DUF4249 family protein [Segatella copri]|uniref:DUF4249 family protein n=1 Tax=Segatella copri TaxID=165179 RepID=UPI003F8AF200
MKKIFEVLIITLLFMVSCTSDTIPDYQPQIVVEGWIENGYAPVVRLYCTVPVNNNENKQEDLYNNTIDDANVAITCDDQTYVLHHEINNSYESSSIYTSNELTGIAGRSYKLTIETKDGKKLEATTSIPYPPEILEKGISQDLGKGKYNLYAKIEDDLAQHRFYKVFVNLDKTHQEEFHSSFLGESDNELFDKPNPKLPIYGFSRNKKENSHVSFLANEQVSVKLCRVDSFAYNYWSEYAKMLELSRNPIFTYQHNLPTNIKGGIGYWLGYGASRFSITIP